MKFKKGVIIFILLLVFGIISAITILKNKGKNDINENIDNNKHLSSSIENNDKDINKFKDDKNRTNKENCNLKSLACIEIDKDANDKYIKLIKEEGKNFEVNEWRDMYFEKFGFSFKIPKNWSLSNPFIYFSDSYSWGDLTVTSPYSGENDFTLDLDINPNLITNNYNISNIEEIIRYTYHYSDLVFVNKEIKKINNLDVLSVLVYENRHSRYRNLYILKNEDDLYFIELTFYPKYLKSAINLFDEIIESFKWDNHNVIDYDNEKKTKFNDSNYQFTFNYPKKWGIVTYSNNKYYEPQIFDTKIPEEYSNNFSFKYDLNKTLLNCQDNKFYFCASSIIPEKNENKLYNIINFVRYRLYKINDKPVAEKIYYDYKAKRYGLYYIIPHFNDYHTFHFNIAKDIFPSGQKIAREIIESIDFKVNDNIDYKIKNWERFPDGFENSFELLY